MSRRPEALGREAVTCMPHMHAALQRAPPLTRDEGNAHALGQRQLQWRQPALVDGVERLRARSCKALHDGFGQVAVVWCGFGSERLNQQVQWGGAILVMRERWFGERFRPWLRSVH